MKNHYYKWTLWTTNDDGEHIIISFFKFESNVKIFINQFLRDGKPAWATPYEDYHRVNPRYGSLPEFGD